MNRVVVAVDGPAGSGKSSVSRQVAVKLGITYIDSGAIYRAITYAMMEQYGELSSDIDFSSATKNIQIKQEYLPDDMSTRTYVDGIDVSEQIRTEDVARNIQWVSSDTSVRNFVTDLLRKWAGLKSVIMDGRDIGSIVFPNADLKIYLDASAQIRAERRFNEYADAGKKVDLKEIKKQIIQRDSQDTTREFGALTKCADAVLIDSSSMSQDQVTDTIITLIEQLADTNRK
ncbi:MAG: (d)CMP kinase [Spirochaetes bacterium]|nr:(d)CMP kinase [Spirochaetota bacterium]